MGAALLEFDGIHVTRGSFALSADLTISKGARVAVIGPSGSGKSTLLSLVGGFLAAVQDADLGVRGERGDAPRDGLHLGHAGQEDEGVHGRVGVERLGVGARGRGRDVVEEGPVHAALGGEAVAAEGGVLLAQRVQHGRGGDHGQGRLLPHAAGPAGGQGRRVHGGGHGHERQLGTQLPQVGEEREEHVCVQVPLVDLVQDHLAGKEMEIGRYYLKRGHYTAAINRFRVVVEEFQTTGQTPLQWQLAQRIVQAKRLLLESNLTVAEVAAQLGFSDQAHLTRAFRQIAGETPAAWRRMQMAG